MVWMSPPAGGFVEAISSFYDLDLTCHVTLTLRAFILHVEIDGGYPPGTETRVTSPPSGPPQW